MQTYEINFDGLVGPTHNYAGLSSGNIASETHGGTTSSPRTAALQGLQKMKFLHELGLKQAVLPPHSRPALHLLSSLGFDSLEHMAKDAPDKLYQCYSASAMWVANAATISPSADTKDGKLHITPANLTSKFHRSIEAPFTSHLLKQIFADANHFVHHDPLPENPHTSDEGAANHTRLTPSHAQAGIEFFVYGRHVFGKTAPVPEHHPARQTFEASTIIAGMHKLSPQKTVFAQQCPKAIDAGVFHNDVICVGNENVLLFHEDAFLNSNAVLTDIRQKYQQIYDHAPLHLLRIKRSRLSLEEAVQNYFFNSQLVTLPNGGMALIAPKECESNDAVKAAINEFMIDSQNPITAAHYLDLRESMKNGGGPACLRLRVVMTEEELSRMHQGVLFSDGLYEELILWVNTHYRDKLTPEDLHDPQLAAESLIALDELSTILGLSNLYDFQK